MSRRPCITSPCADFNTPSSANHPSTASSALSLTNFLNKKEKQEDEAQSDTSKRGEHEALINKLGGCGVMVVGGRRGSRGRALGRREEDLFGKRGEVNK